MKTKTVDNIAALAETQERHDENRERHTNDTRRELLPPPSEPMAVARVFVGRCVHNEILTLRQWRGGWWMWKTTHWTEIDEGLVRSILYRFTENAIYRSADGPQPWSPTRHKISDVADALSAICVLPADIDQPGWLDGATETGVIVSVKNGLLNVEQVDAPHAELFQPDKRAVQLRSRCTRTTALAAISHRVMAGRVCGH